MLQLEHWWICLLLLGLVSLILTSSIDRVFHPVLVTREFTLAALPAVQTKEVQWFVLTAVAALTSLCRGGFKSHGGCITPPTLSNSTKSRWSVQALRGCGWRCPALLGSVPFSPQRHPGCSSLRRRLIAAPSAPARVALRAIDSQARVHMTAVSTAGQWHRCFC